MLWRLFAIAAVVGAISCGDDDVTTTPSLATPIGLTIAGTDEKHVFIANADEDTLQMLTIPVDLEDTAFVRSPARFFPLRIEAGSRPTRIAASDDMRFVTVLDSGTNSLLLIDADTMLKATLTDASEISMALSDAGATPTDMVAQPPCVSGSSTCLPADHLGRVYVSFAADGLILAVDLVLRRDEAGNAVDGDPHFDPVEAYTIGGSPQHLAVSHDGQYLFATDSTQMSVARLTLQGGAIARIDIGDYGGPIAISQDDEVLLVGRSKARDILLIEGATGSMAIVDADALHAPLPQCLADCTTGLNIDDASSGACSDQTPADKAICVGPSGLELVASEPYKGIAVDAVPALITTLGAALGTPQLRYSCTDGDVDVDNDGDISDEEDDRDSSTASYFGEYALVVTEGDRTTGNVLWLSLRKVAGAPLAPQIANGACGKAALDIDAEFVSDSSELDDFTDYQIGNYLSECLPTPDRARFSCASDSTGGGVVVLAGNLPLLSSQSAGPLEREGRWDFTWEGVLDGLDRSSGGGEFYSEDAIFFDFGLELDDFANVQVGDLLEIVSAATNDPECTAVIDTSLGVCQFERTITELPRDDTVLGSDPDDSVTTDDIIGHVHFRYSGEQIEPTCFLNGGRVAYRIRAGNQFLVERSGQQPWRMTLDDRFGPGGTVKNAQHEPVIFGFNTSILNNLFEGEGQATACDRYGSDDHVREGSGQSVILSRDVRFAFIVTDAYRPYVTGRTYSSSGTTNGSAGTIPGDILVHQGYDDSGNALQTKVYITFSGTNTLYGMDPTDATNTTAGDDNTQIILQN